MTSAAAVIRDCRRELAARDGNLLSEVTAGTAAISEWRHYPEGEAYDPKSHSQYFFHAHGGTGRPAAEQGHFHTFLRAEGMPIGIAPLLLPELAVADVPAPPPPAPPLDRRGDWALPSADRGIAAGSRRHRDGVAPPPSHARVRGSPAGGDLQPGHRTRCPARLCRRRLVQISRTDSPPYAGLATNGRGLGRRSRGLSVMRHPIGAIRGATMAGGGEGGCRSKTHSPWQPAWHSTPCCTRDKRLEPVWRRHPSPSNSAERLGRTGSPVRHRPTGRAQRRARKRVASPGSSFTIIKRMNTDPVRRSYTRSGKGCCAR